jgi:excisionase family DNA binding protein
MNDEAARQGRPATLQHLTAHSVAPRSALLTTREVAERLSMSPATVLRRWRAGELPGYRLASNVLRFDERELEEFLMSHRGPAADIRSR